MGRPPNPYQRRQTQQQRHPKRPNPFDPTPSSQKSLSSYALKEKIRDLTRLLEHSTTMPADVRIEKERALAGYRADFEKSKAAVGPRKRNDIISRYHMVRFFERQKATRILKKLQTQLSALSPISPEYKALEQNVHKAEVDMNYTMYYPLLEKYQSLYPRTKEQGPLDEASGKELAGRDDKGPERHPIWFIVERAMTDGTLEALRDGGGKTMALGISRPPPSNKTREAPAMTDFQGRGGGVKLTGGPCSDDGEDDDEEMSDGGFFEE
ncbi:18S rRNA maturation protein [Trapelia coarctata]|nr:18S rRNA maturation protein [Trapelia coarctata]